MLKKLNVSSMEELRQKAENLSKDSRSISAHETPIWHELYVHKLELCVQNEELRVARDELEKDLANYHDLFDLAPMPYFVLAPNGAIEITNFAGASLLGMERAKLPSLRLGSFMSVESQGKFHDFLFKVFTHEAKQNCELIMNKGGYAMHIALVGVVDQTRQRCRILILDITEHKLSTEPLTAAVLH